MKRLIGCIINEESGQGMVEYSLIITLIAITLVFSLKAFSDKLYYSITDSANKLP